MKQQISIKQAVVIGNTITLECSPADCDKVRAVIDENKPLAAVIGTASQKRSLSANAYAWALMNQLAANAAFCFTVPGPKMIWQFGELGYDETLGEEDEKTAKKPLHWEYYDEPARKSLYDVYAKLLDLRKTHANLFGQNATFSWKVETADWTGNTPRTISLKYNDKELVVVGNFGGDTTNYSLDSNIKYNYMTGDEVSGNITVEPHNFFLGTSFRPE